MKPQRRRRFGVRVAEISRRTGVPHSSVLRDHALSYMLAGVAAVTELEQSLVFKGGTALRKCYFAGYRYSEDLDFSSCDLRTWKTAQMSRLIQTACAAAQKLAEAIEAPYTFVAQLQRHREDRSELQHNFRITVGFPTGATLPIKVELTQVEPIIRPVWRLPLLHQFDDEALNAMLPVYSLDEIVLEKLRAFLQTAANLNRRGWTNRARDLYDLWWLWTQQVPVAWSELRDPLGVKAEARGVTFSGPADFLDVCVLRSYHESWQTRLANVVPALPPFDEALAAHRAVLAAVFDTDVPHPQVSSDEK